MNPNHPTSQLTAVPQPWLARALRFCTCVMLVGCGSPAPGAEPPLDASTNDTSAVDARQETSDGADGTDGGSDAGIAGIPCDMLESEWKEFVAGSRGCQLDSDCSIFEIYDDYGGRLTPCDRPPGLQASLNAQHLETAQQFADRYFSPECYVDPFSTLHWSGFGWDGESMRNPRCANSKCTAEIPSCLGSPDSGAD